MGIGGEDLTIVRSGLKIYNLNAQQLTTFSTYGLETNVLWRDRCYSIAAVYWGGSAILGVIAVQLGIILARSGK
ncbi:hypothetical protein QUB47_29340 [Microcoleus sp. AT9_B5]